MGTIKGDNGANTLNGTAEADVIYGFDPDNMGQSVSFEAKRVASGLSQPLFTTSDPNDSNRLFIVEKTGQIKILDLTTGTLQPTPFLDVSGIIDTEGEQGLLGFAFDPNYAANGKVYIYMSNAAGDVEIRQYTTTDGSQVDPASGTVVMTIDFPGSTQHRGGWIGFGPDGYLYASVGDGGTPSNAQDLSTPLGKILRIDVSRDAFPDDPNRNYAIPADNPSRIDGIEGDASGTGIYAAGLRNPWRLSFDRATGELYIADVGEKTAEEINIGRAGANYGWPATEGGFDPEEHPEYTAPIHFYGRDAGGSVTGGYVYRGENEALKGKYVFADYRTGTIWTLDRSTGEWKVAQIGVTTDTGVINNPASFGEDANGNLYIVDIRDGEIYRLEPKVAPGGVDEGDTINARGGDDTVYSGAGNDTIDGGSGADFMAGGVGDDRCLIDNAADVVEERAGEGYDTIRSSVSYTLTDDMHVEVLWTRNTSGTAAIDFTGNAHDNRLSGNAGRNTLSGEGGNDLLKGGGGGDRLLGGAGDDDLRGEAGADSLDGGAGIDKIDGGAGRDTLAGGADADVFVWRSAGETASARDRADIVLDFDGVGGDTLDVSRIDAVAGRAGNQAFTFIGTDAFSAAGQIRYEVIDGNTFVFLSTDRDRSAEATIRLDGVHALQAEWFAL